MISNRTKILKKFTTSKGLKRIFSQADSFMNSQNTVYVEQMYEKWSEDRSSVHPSWDAYFTNLNNGLDSSQAFAVPPSISNNAISYRVSEDMSGSGGISKIVVMETKLMNMIHRYRQRCHEIADIYPVPPELLSLRYGLDDYRSDFQTVIEDPIKYGFTPEELDIPIPVTSEKIGFTSDQKTWTVREANDRLMKIYGGPISFEYIHISNYEIRDWFKERVESFPHFEVSKEERLELFERLVESHSFTEFCKKKYSSAKRFGVDGCDSAISGIEKLVDHSKELGVTNVIMGMAHRGRLNSLACIFNKPYEQIFTEFSDKGIEAQQTYTEMMGWGFSGDVKYHLGATNERIYEDGSKVSMTMLPNPSHLETVGPVVAGKARAKQYNLKDWDGDQVLPIIVHGDAAVAGQGIVYETAQMEKLKAYYVGGSIHVVINNNIGFTTNPRNGRSSLYCTDIAKSTECPVIHVNADQPEYVDWAFKVAAEYRLKFKRDIYVDVVGYRIFGHNEQDFPKFTQPGVYKYLDTKEHMYDMYVKRIVEEGTVTEEYIKEREEHYHQILDEAFEKSKKLDVDIREWDKSIWDKSTIRTIDNLKDLVTTNVSKKDILKLNDTVNKLPEALKFHSIIKRVYSTRHKAFAEGVEIDWGAAEMMAYATLLNEGFKLRISGEDVERGTFSHRHARIFDQETGKSYNTLYPAVAEENKYMVQIYNSHLAEYGPMGFEYGYSIDKPNTLVIWEAQFGDFANVAQCAIDQLIASGERKWGLMNGIVMLLPHGMEGQGPEHSSARLERFLELCDDDPYDEVFQGEDRRAQSLMANMQVCNITNPANYFHLLRLQLMRGFRKPLVVMTPKKLLRYKLARSTIEEFTETKRFTSLYGETFADEVDAPEGIKQVLVCSGKVYFDLLERRRELERKVSP